MTEVSMSMYPHLARQFIDVIGAVVDEFRLSISKDGWEVRAIDNGRVALIDISLPRECFKCYDFEESGVWTSSIDGHPTGVMRESLDVGIGVQELSSVIGDLRDGEPILVEEVNEPIKFTFSNAPRRLGNGYQLELKQGMFKRTMLLINEGEIKRPPAIIKFPSDYMLMIDQCSLLRTIRKSQKVSEYISLGFRYYKSTECMLFVATTEDDIDMPWEAVMNVDVWEKMRDDPKAEARSIFTSEYLENVLKKMPPGMMQVSLGHDYPCKISFGIGTSGKCEYMQAPRLESE